MASKLSNGILRADNAYQSLRPLTYISFLSLAPFKFYMNRKKKMQTSKWLFVIGIIHFALYALCAIDRIFQSWTIILINISGILIMGTNFIFAMTRHQKLAKIMQNNVVVDELFEKFGVKLNYQRTLRHIFLTSMAIVILTIIFIIIRYGSYFLGVPLPPFVSLIRFILPQINITIMVFTFFCITHLARSRFQLVNEILQDIRDGQVEQSSTQMTSPNTSVIYVSPIICKNAQQQVKEVSYIHSILCNTCQTIEEYFSYPMLIIITVSVFIIITDDYYILVALMTKTAWSIYFVAFVSQFLWCTAYILLIVEASCNTISESKISASIVHDILNITDDLQLKDRLFRLSLQLMHRKVNFTAAGMFSLDRTLLFTIAGAATCYLIILLQTRAAAIAPQK